MRRLDGGRHGGGVLLAAALIGGCMFATGLGNGVAATPSGKQTFNDPADDQNGVAPDITSVTVTSDPSGAITFELAVRNYNTVKPRISFTVLVDADRDARSGLDGAEYLLTSGCQLLDRCGAGFWRWNGMNWDSSHASSYSSAFTPSGAGGVQQFRINNADLGGTTGFGFTVNGWAFVSEPLNYDGDTAPNPGAAAWSHTLATAVTGADGDRDGVLDSRDLCPRVPALYDANHNGCPGPFRRMRPDLKFRALGYSSYVSIVSARVEDLPPGAEIEVRCRSACSVRQRQASRAPVVVLTQLHGTRLKRGAVIEIRAEKPGWIGYHARIEIGGSPLTTQTTEQCLPATGKRVPTPCNRVARGT